MNYYERHLGDYAKDTAHLSIMEHGAYTLLLDRYYATEKGIPADQAHRIARARSKDEMKAVDSVLNEFFSLIDGVWIKNRVEEEIARYQESTPAYEEKKLNNKERQRRARDRRKLLFSELRELGCFPAWDASTHELQTELSRIKSHDSYEPVTRDEPVTILRQHGYQSPVSSLNPKSCSAALPNPPPPDQTEDPRKVIFDLGEKILGKNGRALIGKALKNQTEEKIGALLGEMAMREKADPVAYFQAATQAKEAKFVC